LGYRREGATSSAAVKLIAEQCTDTSHCWEIDKRKGRPNRTCCFKRQNFSGYLLFLS